MLASRKAKQINVKLKHIPEAFKQSINCDDDDADNGDYTDGKKKNKSKNNNKKKNTPMWGSFIMVQRKRTTYKYIMKATEGNSYATRW